MWKFDEGLVRAFLLPGEGWLVTYQESLSSGIYLCLQISLSSLWAPLLDLFMFPQFIRLSCYFLLFFPFHSLLTPLQWAEPLPWFHSYQGHQWSCTPNGNHLSFITSLLHLLRICRDPASCSSVPFPFPSGYTA